MSLAKRLEHFWYQKRASRWLFLPLSLIVQMIALLKRWFYQIGLFKSYQLPVPVVVIGNLTVGGTGKTPMIMALVKALAERQVKVGIVSRGYQSQIHSGCHLLTEFDPVELVGDEAFMLKKRLKIPVVIGRDRVEAIRLLLSQQQVDLILSDDGLQHYAMKRAYEIVLIDGQRGLGNQLMLPFGPLREPKSRLKSVDQIVINQSQDHSQWYEHLPVSYANVIAKGLVHLKTGETVSLCNLSEHTITAIAGIGNPQRFFNLLKRFCSTFETKVFEDHHNFSKNDFANIESDMVIMTEKDAVKCYPFAQENWYFLDISLEIESSIVEQLLSLKQN